MSGDLVKRLRDLGDRAEYMPHMHHVAADRIEELKAELRRMALDCLAAEGQAAEAYQAQLVAEAKLADAEVIIRIIASDKWDERLGEAVDLSCEYLAELKGEK